MVLKTHWLQHFYGLCGFFKETGFLLKHVFAIKKTVYQATGIDHGTF